MATKNHWFPHDFHASSDRKLKKLFKKLGASGIGVYWMLIEILYRDNGKTLIDIDFFCDEFNEDETLIKSVIKDFELFINDGEFLTSKGVIERLEKIEQVRKQKSDAAHKSWESEKRKL